MKVHAILVKARGADLETIRSLIDEGRLRTVIDKTYPVTEVAEAQKYSATGRARGKIGLTFVSATEARVGSRIVAR